MLVPAERLASGCTICSPCPRRGGRIPPALAGGRPWSTHSSPCRAPATSRPLIALLDPAAAFRLDEAAEGADGAPPLLGAGAVAEAFMGRAQAAEWALLDGVLRVVFASAVRLLLVLEVSVEDGYVIEIDAVADPELAALKPPHRHPTS